MNCACTSIDVNYSPNRFITHREGQPNEMDVSVSFVEIDKLYKQQFSDKTGFDIF